VRLDEILDICARTDSKHWEFIPMHDGEEGGHYYRAVYRPDLSVSIEWGADLVRDFKEDWTNNFIDSRASSHRVDVLYHGTIVFHSAYVSVDGARAYVPLGARRSRSNAPARGNLQRVVSYWEYEFIELLHSFSHAPVEYKLHFDQSGYKLV
jgi:hypothetical protein